MRILLLNTVCKTGSTGKIAYNLHKYLIKNGHDSILCYGKGQRYKTESNLIKISTNIELYIHILLTRLSGLQGTYSYFATRKLLKTIKDYKPDIVHLFNLHGYYINEFKVLNYLKESNIKVVYSMLDEYPYMGKCCYSFDCNKFETECNQCPQYKAYPKSSFFDKSRRIFNLKKQCYTGFKKINFTGPQWVIGRALKSSLLKNMQFSVIDEFTDLENMFYPRQTEELRSKLRIPRDKKIVLNVARLSDVRKGGSYYLKMAKALENENIVFIHVGYNGDKQNLPSNFIPISYVANQDELAEYYSLADLFVCTSLADTMPNTCIESLSCGTPICGFDIAGTPYVTTSEFGFFTSLENIDRLITYIKNMSFKTPERSFACRSYAESRYSKNLICSKLLNLY